MILVDISIPALDKTYDFQLDERAKVCNVLEEVVEMIRQKEKNQHFGENNEFILCCKQSEAVLSYNKTLEQCGVCTGNKLLLL